MQLSTILGDLSLRKLLWIQLLIWLTALLVYVLWLLVWRKKYSQMVPCISPSFFSIFGSFASLPLRSGSRNDYPLNVHLLELLSGYQKLFPKEKMITLWAFCTPLLILVNADAIEAVISEHSKQDIRKPWFYKWPKQAIGDGIFVSEGSKWRSRRKIINSCFHADILKDFVSVFDKKSKDLVRTFEKNLDKFVDVRHIIGLCAMEIILETLFSEEVTRHGNFPRIQIVNAVQNGQRLLVERFSYPYHWVDFIYKYSAKGKEFERICSESKIYVKECIQLQKQHLENMVDLKDLRKTLLCFLVQLLMKEELTEEDVADEMISNMIAETMRLYPPAALFAREIPKDTTICNYFVPKRTTCVIFPSILHRDEDVFPNPEKFDPDRFLRENSTFRNTFAYIPFSAGPRNCIGQKFALMETKTIFSNILRNLSVESLDQRDIILPSADISLKSPKPVKLKFSRRSSSSQ